MWIETIRVVNYRFLRLSFRFVKRRLCSILCYNTRVYSVFLTYVVSAYKHAVLLVISILHFHSPHTSHECNLVCFSWNFMVTDILPVQNCLYNILSSPGRNYSTLIVEGSVLYSICFLRIEIILIEYILLFSIKKLSAQNIADFEGHFTSPNLLCQEFRAHAKARCILALMVGKSNMANFEEQAQKKSGDMISDRVRILYVLFL